MNLWKPDARGGKKKGSILQFCYLEFSEETTATGAIQGSTGLSQETEKERGLWARAFIVVSVGMMGEAG